VGFNYEVAKEGALYWEKKSMNLSRLIDSSDQLKQDEIDAYDERSLDRIIQQFSWNKIVQKYEGIFLSSK
jgi:rhamnosyltransferase